MEKKTESRFAITFESAFKEKLFTATLEMVTVTSSSTVVVDLLHDDIPPTISINAGMSKGMRRFKVFFTFFEVG